MLAASAERILRELGPEDLVLDVGAGISPFARANWVIDVMPFEARREPGAGTGEAEHFEAETWVRRDICDREPWPFEDDQFDFAICSHTLEDVRDPVWVCAELNRVAKAGYIEVPSRLEEQSHSIQGPWVGWGHHRWFTDLTDGGLEFVFKHHVVHGQPQAQFPPSFHQGLTPEQRVLSLWWEGSFDFRERLLLDAEALDPYLADYVQENGPSVEDSKPWIRRLLRR